MKRAYNDGYDGLWLMDDDAEPLNDSLERLLDYANESIAVFCSTIIWDGNIYFNYREYLGIGFLHIGLLKKSVTTNGLLKLMLQLL